MPASDFCVVTCDDHPPMRLALRVTLQRLHPHAQVLEADSGRGLLSLLVQTPKIDLLTLDMQLPDMPGLELLQRVKVLRPRLPVVVLSADETPATIMAALEQGACSYITKSSSETVLTHALQSALGGAITLPHVEPPLRQPANPLDGLTPRQRDVLQCLLRGMSTKQISQELGITPGTASDHTIAVFRHFDVKSRAMVIVEAQRQGIGLASFT